MDNIQKVADFPLIFLGVAEQIQLHEASPGVVSTDIFRLSKFRRMTIVPATINDLNWVFALDYKVLGSRESVGADVVLRAPDGKSVKTMKFNAGVVSEPQETEMRDDGGGSVGLLVLHNDLAQSVIYVKFPAILSIPGAYSLCLKMGSEEFVVGQVNFIYQEAPRLTPEQIMAIKANPHSVKSVRIELRCKKCNDKYRAYSALDKSDELEKEGYVPQERLPDAFRCQCGETNQSLRYMRESLHALLGVEKYDQKSLLSYVRGYAREEIASVVRKYSKLLDDETTEPPVQTFLEDNPIMFARFHARRLWVKPNILGKHQPDFAILDSQGQLWLIEIEKSALRLFLGDGHPTAELNHAHDQVVDWLHDYSKYPQAVLDVLRIKPDEVMSVRGTVIAGRIAGADQGHLQRFLSNPRYSKIEFMTLDDLSASLVQISRDLA